MEPKSRKDLIDLLNKCWITHDGMWFYHSMLEFGIQSANRMNKAAIRSLAPIEMGRLREYLGMDERPMGSFEDFKSFFVRASDLLIPDFMNARMSFPRANLFHWEFKSRECFAYKGMKRIGVLEQYECGVIYRLECWLDSLGVKYEVVPKVSTCLMVQDGNCAGDFLLQFP